MKRSNYLFVLMAGVSFATLPLMARAFAGPSPDAAGTDSAAVAAGPADPIHFRSTLRADDGKPLPGVHRVEFLIRATGGENGPPLWAESLSIQSGADGRYAAELAASAPERFRAELRTHPLLYVTASIPGSAKVSIAKVITTIPQGMWVDCNPDNGAGSCDAIKGITAESELQTVAAAHFRYVINDSNLWGTQAQITAWANQANASGIKIIWYLPMDFVLYQGTSTKNYSVLTQDTELASSFCSGCTNAAFTTALINFLKTFPATAGYYIDDEDMNMAAQSEVQNYKGQNVSETTIASDLKTLSSTILAADAKHTIYGAETWDSVNNATEGELAGYLDPIETTLNVMGADYYPVGTGEAASTEAAAAGYLDTIATGYKKATLMNLQAYSWEDFFPGACQSKAICVYPTISQLQTMLQAAATAPQAPALLVWFDYGDTVSNNQWSNLVSAADPQ